MVTWDFNALNVSVQHVEICMIVKLSWEELFT